MRLSPAQHAELAAELQDAARRRVMITRPSLRHPQMDLDDSYAIQQAWSRAEQRGGRRVAGHKVGLTAAVMRRATGLDQPDFGVIFVDQVHPDGAQLAVADHPMVRVELELAFELATDLTPPFTVARVLAATAAVRPALEVLASRVQFEGRSVLDTISDNAALGAVVLGERRTAADAWDRQWEGGLLARNDQIEETGLACAVLDDPAASVAWLAQTLHDRGEQLQAGELVLSGSLVAPLWVQPGDRLTGRFHTLGEVSCRFH